MRTLLFLSFFLVCSAYSWAQIADLSQDEKNQLFKEKTTKRINDLQTNITIIGDKENENNVRVLAVNASVKYFRDEDAIFEVGSINNITKSFKVRQYLNRLKDLPYYQVEIKWYESEWISDFTKGPDGSYFGTVRLFQIFKGSGPDGSNMYTDITSKDISVRIDIREIATNQGKKEVLLVKLGDVNVVETKKT